MEKKEALENLKLILSSPNPRPPSTVASYLSVANLFLTWLDKLPPDDMDIRRYFLHKRSLGQKESTLAKTFQVLKRLFEANEWEWKFASRDRPEVPVEYTTPAFTQDEVARLIRNRDLYTHNECFYLAIASIYGPRRVELARIGPKSIRGNTIFIDTAKKGEKRTQLIPEGLMPYIKAYHPKQHNVSALSATFHRIIKKAGLPSNKGYGWHCVPPDTLIISDTGYKPISEVKVGDLVYDSKGNLTQIIDTFSHPYIGELFEIKGKGILPFMVTENHPLLVARIRKNHWNKKVLDYIRWKLPSELTAKDYLVMPRLSANGNEQFLSLEPYVKKYGRGHLPHPLKEYQQGIPLTSHICYLLGRWLADGSSSKGQVDISYGPEENMIEIASWIEEELGFKTRQFKKTQTVKIKDRVITGTSRRLLFGGEVLARFLKANIGSNSHTKKIPPVIFHTNLQLNKSFIDGYIDGDGYRGEKRIEASTVSKGLALQLQLLLTRLSIFAAISNSKSDPTRYKICLSLNRAEKNIGSWQPNSPQIETLPLLKTMKASPVVTDGDHFFLRIKEVKPVVYNGVVCNIETESGTYLVNSIVTHNSFRHTLDTLLPTACAKADIPLTFIGYFLRWSRKSWGAKILGAPMAGAYVRPEILSDDPFYIDRQIFSIHPFLSWWEEATTKNKARKVKEG